jgi:hypothetical protein
LGVFDIGVPEESSQSAPESTSDELDLSGIDDLELVSEYIRTPEEVDAQEEIWMALNGEFMIELLGINFFLFLFYVFVSTIFI